VQNIKDFMHSCGGTQFRQLIQLKVIGAGTRFSLRSAFHFHNVYVSYEPHRSLSDFKWMNERVSESVSERVNVWMNEWTNERTNEWMNEWMKRVVGCARALIVSHVKKNASCWRERVKVQQRGCIWWCFN